MFEILCQLAKTISDCGVLKSKRKEMEVALSMFIDILAEANGGVLHKNFQEAVAPLLRYARGQRVCGSVRTSIYFARCDGEVVIVSRKAGDVYETITTWCLRGTLEVHSGSASCHPMASNLD